MKKVLYIHGLGGSGDGRVATLLRNNLTEYRIIAPEIPIEPKQALDFIRDIISKDEYDLVVGSSLGAYYLMYCGYMPKKLLINPAVKAGEYIEKYIGKGVQKFRSVRSDGETEYTIDDAFISDLKNMEFSLDDEDRLSIRCIVSPDDELFGKENVEQCIKKFHSRNVFLIHSSHSVEDDIIINDIIPKIKDFIEEDIFCAPIMIGPYVDFDDE